MGLQNTQPSAGGDSFDLNPSQFGSASADTALSDAIVTFKKRRKIILVAVLLGLAYGIYKAKSQPRLYQAVGRIQVRSGSSNEYRLSAVQALGGSDTASKMLTEIVILKSDSLMLTVARQMDLANNPEFTDTSGPREYR
jgi:uncharacterized protein involved in exopolysaccharide biosynthesis